MILSLAVFALFLTVQAVAVVAFSNRVVMRMSGEVLKSVIMLGASTVWVFGAFVLIVFNWNATWVQGFLHLHPQVPGAWALTSLLAIECALTLVFLIHKMLLCNHTRQVRGLRSIHTSAINESKPAGFPGFDFSTEDLHLAELELELPNLPDSKDGFRLLHLTDFHVETDAGLAKRAIALARSIDPDAIAVTGDYVISHLTPALCEVFDELATLEPPCGLHVIRGNHDFWHADADVQRALNDRGISLLDNRTVSLDGDEGKLVIVGCEHPWKPVKNWHTLLGTERGVCRIVMTHTPDNFPTIARHEVDLVLAGHTHGGQWRLPLIGSVVVPSLHGTHFDHGLFEQSESVMWVGRGLGTVGFHLRINCPPEVTLITLRSPRAVVANAEEDLRVSAA